jgi:hypothetical protein
MQIQSKMHMWTFQFQAANAWRRKAAELPEAWNQSANFYMCKGGHRGMEVFLAPM